MNLDETNLTYTIPAESLSRKEHVLKFFLTIENDSTFNESPTEYLRKRAFEDNQAQTKPTCMPPWPY